MGKQIVDPLFGELRLDRSEFLTDVGQPRSRKYFKYWIGRIQFPPENCEIGVFLPGDESGPTEDQRSTFRDLTSRWPTLIEPFMDDIYPVYCLWFSKTPNHRVLARDELLDALELAGFEIEHPTLYPWRKEFQDFQVCFDFPGLGADHDLIVHVKDWHVSRASFEG